MRSHNRSISRRFHFQKRWRERVGEVLSNQKYTELCNLTRTTGKFLYRDSVDELGSVYGIKYMGMSMKVVFDAFKGELITILPKKHQKTLDSQLSCVKLPNNYE